MEIVQISDTHFGTETPEVVEALVSCLTESPPDTVLLTGDVTQRARKAQFARAREFLKRLPAHEFLAIPGNHDIPLYHLWRRLLKPYQEFQRFFRDVEVRHFSDACTIIGVNSTRPSKHKDGILTQEKIDQVARELADNQDSTLRIVAAHHPLAVVLPSDRENLVENAEAAIKAWSEAGMDLVLGGHIHYPFMAPLSGYYPHIGTDAWVMQAGTATSRRIRNEKPNSFNRISIKDSRAHTCIEQWNYQEDSGRFECVESFRPWSEKPAAR